MDSRGPATRAVPFAAEDWNSGRAWMLAALDHAIEMQNVGLPVGVIENVMAAVNANRGGW